MSLDSFGLGLIGFLCLAFAVFGLLRGVTWLGSRYTEKDSEPIFFRIAVAMNAILGMLILYAAWTQR